MTLKAPFPWFGGKSKVADVVWSRLGDVYNYVEPFFGSGAVLLQRPHNHTNTLETVNDYDGYITNFWRAIKHAPSEVARYANDLQSENDLHARHVWLLQHRELLRSKLEGDPEYYNAKVAGWWVWGICLWIGSGWCSGNGSWHSVNGQLVNLASGQGVRRKIVHLGPGMGVHRSRIHLGTAGQGVHRQLVHLGSGQGVHDWFDALSARLRYVRVAAGDWSRVCGPTPTFKQGLTGVFLDPPYDDAMRDSDLYRIDSGTVAGDVLQWCIDNGDNPLLRIALCGYEGEHNVLLDHGWQVHKWSGKGGYDTQRKNGTNDNKHKERVWFSPHCIGSIEALPLFARMNGS